LPDFDKARREANFTPDEMRAEMKRMGILPPRTFQERDIIIASTGVRLSLLITLQTSTLCQVHYDVLNQTPLPSKKRHKVTKNVSSLK